MTNVLLESRKQETIFKYFDQDIEHIELLHIKSDSIRIEYQFHSTKNKHFKTHSYLILCFQDVTFKFASQCRTLVFSNSNHVLIFFQRSLVANLKTTTCCNTSRRWNPSFPITSNAYFSLKPSTSLGSPSTNFKILLTRNLFSLFCADSTQRLRTPLNLNFVHVLRRCWTREELWRTMTSPHPKHTLNLHHTTPDIPLPWHASVARLQRHLTWFSSP